MKRMTIELFDLLSRELKSAIFVTSSDHLSRRNTAQTSPTDIEPYACVEFVETACVFGDFSVRFGREAQ